MVQVSLTPFIIIPVLLYTGNDNPNILYNIILTATATKPNPPLTILSRVGRCFNIFFCAFEGSRMIGCVGLIAFMRILAYTSYLNELSNLLKCKKRSKFSIYKDVLRLYDKLRISIKHEHEMLSNLSAILLFTMFTVLLTTNFICLKMHHVFPPHFFAFFPTSTLTMYGVLHLGVDALLLGTNRSAGVLADMRGEVASVRIRIRRKWLKRRMKSVKVLQVPVGIDDNVGRTVSMNQSSSESVNEVRNRKAQRAILMIPIPIKIQIPPLYQVSVRLASAPLAVPEVKVQAHSQVLRGRST
ncbi:hypothetical protein Fcan01_28417 [Folsomia candida]|uniref:Uncharacterized protein n=1 Tax=Folsomia candida TaxID=158441 RepID=A0A226CVM4_FOLCA|nr:hypothetical protein Fcan01_28417 [Folsomia candida]